MIVSPIDALALLPAPVLVTLIYVFVYVLSHEPSRLTVKVPLALPSGISQEPPPSTSSASDVLPPQPTIAYSMSNSDVQPVTVSQPELSSLTLQLPDLGFLGP